MTLVDHIPLTHARRSRRRSTWVWRCCGLTLLFAMIAYIAEGGIWAIMAGTRMLPLFAMGFVAFALTALSEGGPKRSIVFLRHFGDVVASAIITNALRRSLHRQYRLVALDDAILPAKGVAAWTLLHLGGWLFAAGILCALMIPVITSPENNTGFAAGAVFTMMFTQVIFKTFVIIGVYFAHRICIRRRARLRITLLSDIAVCDKLIRTFLHWSRSPSWMAPQSVVVEVANNLWQPAVVDICGSAAMVIIDISHPGEGVCWEVEALYHRRRPNLVLVGERNNVTAWLARTKTGDFERRLLSAIGDGTALLYDNTRAGKRLLRINLANALDNAQHSSPLRGGWADWKLALRVATNYAATFVGVTIGLMGIFIIFVLIRAGAKGTHILQDLAPWIMPTVN